MRSRPLSWLTSLTLLALLGLLALPAAAQPALAGAEQRVNTNTVTRQRTPVVASDGSGRFLVVWQNEQLGIRGRFYDRSGRVLGGEMALVANDNLPSVPGHGQVVTRLEPTVVFNRSGRFVVAWTEETADLTVDYFFESRNVLDRGIFAQRFERGGAPMGDRVRISPVGAGFQSHPVAVRNGRNNFFIAWQNVDKEAGNGAADGVFGRCLARTGVPATAVVKLSSDGAEQAANPAVAAGDSGAMLVAWEQGGAGADVFARRLGAAGQPLGDAFQVNTDASGRQRRAAVAAGVDGGYLVTWQGDFGDSLHTRIFSRRIGAGGAPAGEAVQVSSGIGKTQIGAVAAPLKAGGYLVAWLDWNDNFPIGVFTARVRAAGVDGELALSSSPIDAAYVIGLAADGDLALAAWEGFQNHKAGITARRLSD